MSQSDHSRQPYAWTVPVALLVGIVIAFTWHLPVYSGLVLAFVWSACYARRRGHAWRTILQAALQGIRTLSLICVVLLLVGGVVALWMDMGTIPALVHIGSSFLHTDNLVWMSFLLASALSMVIGSSIATWSVLGPPLLAMAPPHLHAWLAGALVSGGMVGDRSSPMSSSTVLMSTTCQVSLQRVLRQLNKTALLPFMLTLCLYIAANRVLNVAISPLGTALPPGPPLWLIVPALLVVCLAITRVPLIYNLGFAFAVALALDEYHVRPTFFALCHTAWMGYPWLQSGQVVHIGGIFPMLTAVVLIVAAGAFQGVTALGESMDSLTRNWFAGIHHTWTFVLSAYSVCLVYSMMMGSQMLSVLMSGNTLRVHFQAKEIPAESLLQVIGDAPELLPAVIPWNLLGLQAFAILRVPTQAMAPLTWFIILTVAVSFIRTLRAVNRSDGSFPQLTQKKQASSPVSSDQAY